MRQSHFSFDRLAARLLPKPKVHEHMTGNLPSEIKQKGGENRYLVFVPGIGSTRLMTTRIRNEALARNYGVIDIHMSEQVFHRHPEATATHFQRVAGILEDQMLAAYYNGATSYTVVGISMGCIPAALIATNDLVDRLVLVSPADTLVDAIGGSIAGDKIVADYNGFGVSREELAVAWTKIDPVTQVPKLTNTSVRILLSREDLGIPFERGMALVDAMDGQGIEVDLSVNRFLGHYGTVVKYHLFPEF